MRILNPEECNYVSGGAGGQNPVVGVFSNYVVNPNGSYTYTYAANGFTTIVNCPAPLTTGFGLEITSRGKIIEFGANITSSIPQDCTTTTTNGKTGAYIQCKGNTCTSYDKNGVKLSENEDGYSGFAGLDDLTPSGGFTAFAGDNAPDILGGTIGYEAWDGPPGTQPTVKHAAAA